MSIIKYTWGIILAIIYLMLVCVGGIIMLGIEVFKKKN